MDESLLEKLVISQSRNSLHFVEAKGCFLF
jgi:hypothetical protein